MADDEKKSVAELAKALKERVGKGDKEAGEEYKTLMKLLGKEEALVDEENKLTADEIAALAAKKKGGSGVTDVTGGGSGSGKKGGKGGSGIFKGIKKGYNKVNDPFVAFQEGVTDKVKATANFADQTVHPWGMALLALLLHFFDFISPLGAGNFDRGTSQGLAMFTAYGLFALWAALGYYRTGLSRASLRYFVISLLAFFLPYLLRIPFLSSMKYVPAIIAITPIWFLFICSNEESSTLLYKIGKYWIYAIVVMLFIIAIGRFSMPDLFVSSGVNIGKDVKDFFADYKETWSDIKQRFVEGGLLCVNCWQEKIDKTFNPYMPYYTGVEENQKEETGVFIRDLRSLFPVYYNDTNVAPQIVGRVEAKTFIPGGLLITPSCRLERGKMYFYGKSDPPQNEPLELNYKLLRDVTCTYPWHKNMTRGSYKAVMGLSFKYETWSYITLTFVSRSLIEQYYYQKRDINADLDIPETAKAVYTNGPVELGLAGEQQPIDINTEAKRPEQLIQQRFGFTVANKWPQGRVKEVNGVTIMVPKPFILTDCTPVKYSFVDEAEEYRNYTFERIGQDGSNQIDPHYDYSTIYCQLDLPSAREAEQILAFGEKTPVTFVVIARYLYELEEKTNIKIEDST